MQMAPWPDIVGIDSADACERWCGDAALFTTMLARLFDEFDQLNVPAEFNDSEGVAPYIGRMHKLRGGACMLGAKGVYELAGEVEEACNRGDYDRAVEVSIRLTDEIQRLRESAQTVLAAAQHRERGITNAAS
jgi:hypothetical protein